MNTGEMQTIILEKTGIKSSVKKGTGSMKKYFLFTPMLQGGQYPTFPFEATRELKALYPGEEPNPNFFSVQQISIYNIEDNRIEFKKERKPAQMEDLKSPSWGSKNSQVRLDKAARRFAKRMQNGTTGVRYY